MVAVADYVADCDDDCDDGDDERHLGGDDDIPFLAQPIKYDN